MRVLVVEDNHPLRESLRASLVEAGYAVDVAADGETGQEFAESAPYDAIVLDVMLPKKTGLDVCRDLRRGGSRTPLLLLTARDSIDDRVRGLDSGADDYLVKPFALDELLARLRALLRREAPRKESVLQVADLLADPATHHVERAGQRIELTAREFALLEYFMRHANHLITRQRLEEHVWSYDYSGTSNIVDVYIRRLRRKIDDAFPIKLFVTVRGVGYRLQRPS